MVIPVERQHRRLANSRRTPLGTNQQVWWSALSTLGGNSNQIGLSGGATIQIHNLACQGKGRENAMYSE